MTLMLGVPNRTYVTAAGTVYIADQYGVIPNVSTVADVTSLKSAGCSVLTPPPTDLIGSLKGANFNSTADQIIPLSINVKFRVRRITVLNTSVAGMSTAVGGVYTAISKGGSALVANTQAYTGLTNALTALDLTLALPNLVLAAGTLIYLSLTTGQGATATADVFLYGDTFA